MSLGVLALIEAGVSKVSLRGWRYHEALRSSTYHGCNGIDYRLGDRDIVRDSIVPFLCEKLSSRSLMVLFWGNQLIRGKGGGACYSCGGVNQFGCDIGCCDPTSRLLSGRD